MDLSQENKKLKEENKKLIDENLKIKDTINFITGEIVNNYFYSGSLEKAINISIREFIEYKLQGIRVNKDGI